MINGAMGLDLSVQAVLRLHIVGLFLILPRDAGFDDDGDDVDAYE